MESKQQPVINKPKAAPTKKVGNGPSPTVDISKMSLQQQMAIWEQQRLKELGVSNG